MPNPTGVSRRIQQSIIHLQNEDFEGALVNLFPAIDKTAKKRRSKDGVGKRIKKFLSEEEVLISAIGTGNVFKDICINGVNIPDALYKFGRTSIAHEGELDPRLEFNREGSILIGVDKWNLPSGYIMGMCIAVIIAPENEHEQIDQPLVANLFGEQFLVNDIWGKKDLVHNHVSGIFKNPDLFS